MRLFELRFYDLCRDKYEEDLENFAFENWSHFFDDCENLFKDDKMNTNNILSILNSVSPSIQFTMEYSKDAIPFVDTAKH